MQQSFFQYTEGKKMGIRNEADQIIIPAIYDFIAPFSDGLFTVREGDHTAYFDEEGVMALPFENKYDAYGNFTEGLARVQLNERWGFINKEGRLVIAPQFLYADVFSDGMAIVRNAQDLYGAIDTSGHLAVDYQFPHLNNFIKGYAKFGDLHTWGLINKAGNIVVPQQYIFIGDDIFRNEVTVQVQEGKEVKEGLLTIGGGVVWNNNLDPVNIFNKKKEAFALACKHLIDRFYRSGCPCEHERFRNFIQWNNPAGFVDQEILFGAFQQQLLSLEQDQFQCPTCGTCYQQQWEQYSAFLWVLNVAITQMGNFTNKGAKVTDTIPVALGFYGHDIQKYNDRYVQSDIATVIGYLQQLAT